MCPGARGRLPDLVGVRCHPPGDLSGHQAWRAHLARGFRHSPSRIRVADSGRRPLVAKGVAEALGTGRRGGSRAVPRGVPRGRPVPSAQVPGDAGCWRTREGRVSRPRGAPWRCRRCGSDGQPGRTGRFGTLAPRAGCRPGGWRPRLAALCSGRGSSAALPAGGGSSDGGWGLGSPRRTACLPGRSMLLAMEAHKPEGSGVANRPRRVCCRIGPWRSGIRRVGIAAGGISPGCLGAAGTGIHKGAGKWPDRDWATKGGH